MAISLKPDHLKRYKDLGLLFWKYGRSDFMKSSGLDEIFQEKEQHLLNLDGHSKPEELANDLEAMGPIYVKLGQLLSTRNDIFPPEYLDALAKLQDHLEPFSFEKVEIIVQEELGVRISKAFLSF